MKLSILICTIYDRAQGYLPALLTTLSVQKTKDVEILYLGDFKDMTTAQKRNKLLLIARGQYVSFVDDDDKVSDDYVKDLLDATKTDADVITFLGRYVTEWENTLVKYHIEHKGNHNLKNIYTRMPNHICCIKREIAKDVGFLPNLNVGEDYEFSVRLRRKIKTAHHINKELYYYHYNHEISETLKRLKK